MHTASYRDGSVAEALLPRHFFVYLLGGERDDTSVESWDGSHYVRGRPPASNFSLLVPQGQRYVGKTSGSGSYRYILSEIEHSMFTRVLGENVGEFDLRPYSGPNLVAPGLLERVAALCAGTNDFPLAYAESLASMLVVELFNASATKPIPREIAVSVGSERFKIALDFIEEYLDRDIGLYEVASLVGLSVTHFSHAFKTSYGISPYRFILQRRVQRAKTLLRTSNETIAAIASSVGYSSQSRFSADFAKFVGTAPSAYRSDVRS